MKLEEIDLDGNGIADSKELGAWARAGLRVAWWLIKVFAPSHTIARKVVDRAEKEGVQP